MWDGMWDGMQDDWSDHSLWACYPNSASGDRCDERAVGDYVRKVNEEGRKGLQLVVLGACTCHCAWMHIVQAPNPIQDQVCNVQPGS